MTVLDELLAAQPTPPPEEPPPPQQASAVPNAEPHTDGKSHAKSQRDRDRYNQHRQPQEEEDGTVAWCLGEERRFLEATAFRDEREGFKGEVIARACSPMLNVDEGDILRDRKRRYTHPSYVRYGL